MAKKTREAILVTALDAFGNEGSGQVSTNDIADMLDISPGNVYYYFKSKKEIIEELYRWFSTDFTGFLQGTRHNGTPGEVWLVLSLCFQLLLKYRFIFRDANPLLSKFPELRRPFQALMRETYSAADSFCRELIRIGLMAHPPKELAPLVTNLHLVFTQWISYTETLPNASEADQAGFPPELIAQGVQQLIDLLRPYLSDEAVAAFSASPSDKY